MYQRAGMRQDTPCSATGMFSTGKIMPESMMTGTMNSMPDTRSAATWGATSVETSIPSPRARMM